MKIEIGESLFYSWLRHVKECQIVQTNWKPSQQWTLLHETELHCLQETAETLFLRKYNYKIFKQNSSLAQIIQQGECDVIGISIQNGMQQYYAVDVAFHGSGLNYGSKDETVMKVVAKCVRTAICLYGYMDAPTAEIIFASPKINPAVLNILLPCLEDVNGLFSQLGFPYRVRLITNEHFHDMVMQPILLLSDGIADTTELFVRSYQMYTMFSDPPVSSKKEHSLPGSRSTAMSSLAYGELKIGKLVQTVLRRLLEEGAADEEEIILLQQEDYSKKALHINYPLLVRADINYNPARYYSKPITIHGTSYMLCNDWYESAANNDRPHLTKWIEQHRGGPMT